LPSPYCPFLFGILEITIQIDCFVASVLATPATPSSSFLNYGRAGQRQ
jgi:hypothetical protein